MGLWRKRENQQLWDCDDEWIVVTEKENVFQEIIFSVVPKISRTQISSRDVERLQFFKLFFTIKLIYDIINERNYFEKTQIRSKKRIEYCIWNA